MVESIKVHVYPVSDLEQAKAIFTAGLGVEPYVDTPYYVGYQVGDQEIGLDPNGHQQGVTHPIDYWEVPDIKASLQALVDAGAHVQDDVKDVGGAKLRAIVQDGDGNLIGLLQS
jgi:predicted enzyme related to lactoylglutathione lyase